MALLALVAAAAVIISFGLTLGPDRFAGFVAIVMLIAIGALEYGLTLKRNTRVRKVLSR